MDKFSEIEYFASINGIYRQIMKEKVNFTSLLGDQWDSLPVEEQNALLDEHFVAPHIQQKYQQQDNTYDDEDDDDDEDKRNANDRLPEFFPVYKIKSGQRIVEDDEGETWQDEHSGPFSWETSSQSEFTMDFNSTETLRHRTFDPKRPKSPRLMRSGSGELATRPGALEKSGSTDFQQLRHIWETHHTLTPDTEMPPTLSSFLSKSQTSLNGELSNFSKKMSASVNSIVECEDEDSKKDETKQDEVLVAKAEKEKSPVSVPKLVASPVKERRDPQPSPEPAAPLATKEEDEDIAGAMEADIVKLSEIQTRMKETLAETKPESKTTEAQATSASAEVKDNGEVDILAKYGVTFSYGEESKGATSKVEDESKDSTNAALPASFDFLSAW